jgi:hypothetical protein
LGDDAQIVWSHLRPNTGLIPYHVFVHTSSGMCHAIIGNAPLLQLPPVTSFDVIFPVLWRKSLCRKFAAELGCAWQEGGYVSGGAR